ncbi:MAG: hypothetical protein WA019_00315 [Candidatus Moraniibacteriota bacterium]
MRAPKGQFFLDAEWEFAGFLVYVPMQSPKGRNLILKDDWFYEFRGTGIKEAPKKIWVSGKGEIYFVFSDYSVVSKEADKGTTTYVSEFLVTKNDSAKDRFLVCIIVHLSLNRGQRNIFEPLTEIESLFK